MIIRKTDALETNEDNHIILPIAVLEKLDALKTSDGKKGAM
jgi:predicted ribonuclease YlaK